VDRWQTQCGRNADNMRMRCQMRADFDPVHGLPPA